MKLKILRHWILVIAIACLVGNSLVSPSKAENRRPFIHEYPKQIEYSDAHDKYFIDKSFYPINGPSSKTKKRNHSTSQCPTSAGTLVIPIL